MVITAAGVAIASSIITAAGAAYSAHQQYKAAQEATKIADANAKREIEEANQEAKRRQKELDLTLAETRARTAASGLKMGGTAQMYMEAQEETGLEEIAWIKKSGKSKAALARAEGRQARRQAYTGMWSSLFSGATSSMSLYGESLPAKRTSPGRIKN